ncbi:MAG: DUF5009 domain-containing protein [Bacteroidota bacterium]|nr:DUF5009 domain-containing protein [Bacteroidota bacterium]
MEKPARLMSLDALRGFDMFWIIGGETVFTALAKASNNSFLNAISVQMDHVDWEGFHFYDLIMPLFLFMVGMSIPFSTAKRISLGETSKKIYFHAFKRSVILFLLGMVCQCHLLSFDINKLHLIHDTLQSIAIGYFFSILIFTRLKLRSQLILTSGLLLLYFGILQLVAVPGHEAGYMTPEINISKYVEHLVFGRFDDAPSAYTWFLGSLGFVATVMTGVFASTIIRTQNLKIKWVASSNMLIHKTVALAVAGLALVVAGQLANIWFPIIKHIWNPSFVLFSSGLSFLLMALFYYLIDVKGYQRWAFWLKVIGMNSIFIYMAVHLIDFNDIAQNLVHGFEQLMNDYYPAFRSAVQVSIEYAILYWMYKKGTFVKV